MNWYYQHLCIGNEKNKAKQLALTRYIWPILDTFGWYTIWEGSAKVKLRWLSGACLTFYQAQKRIKNGANGYHQFAAAFFAIYQYILSTLMSTRACVCVCGFNNNKLYFNQNFIHCNMERKNQRHDIFKWKIIIGCKLTSVKNFCNGNNNSISTMINDECPLSIEYALHVNPWLISHFIHWIRIMCDREQIV